MAPHDSSLAFHAVLTSQGKMVPLGLTEFLAFPRSQSRAVQHLPLSGQQPNMGPTGMPTRLSDREMYI